MHNGKEIFHGPPALIDSGSSNTFYLPDNEHPDKMIAMTNLEPIDDVLNKAPPLSQSKSNTARNNQPTKITVVVDAGNISFEYRLLVNSVELNSFNSKMWKNLIYFSFKIVVCF